MTTRPFSIALAASLAWASTAAAAPDWSQAKDIEVTLSSYDFAPKRLHLRQGEPYRLHFVNRGPGKHDFSAPAFFAAATVHPEDAASLEEGEVDLRRGESKEVRLVPAAGAYRFKCTRFLHSAFGMHGSITVD